MTADLLQIFTCEVSKQLISKAPNQLECSDFHFQPQSHLLGIGVIKFLLFATKVVPTLSIRRVLLYCRILDARKNNVGCADIKLLA